MSRRWYAHPRPSRWIDLGLMMYWWFLVSLAVFVVQRAAFQAADVDGNGMADKQELTSLMVALGLE